jgi:sialic acid synthase SpsE
MKNEIVLFDKKIGIGHPTFVIAEIGLNHNGSIEIAKKLIDSAKESGCDAVKFQKRTVDQLAIKSFLDMEDVRFPSFGKTYREVRKHVEFNEDQLFELKTYSESQNISFFLTPFDLESVKTVKNLKLEVVKSASHNLTFIPLIKEIIKLGIPVIISTGMSTLQEVDYTVSLVKESKIPFSLLHCVSAYPTPAELVNLNLIDFLRERYNVPIGYSGHEEFSTGSLATLSAVAKGACIVERHITLDNKMEGFDHKISLNPADLKDLVSKIRMIDRMMGNGKKELLPEEKVKREQQRVSIATLTDIPLGTVIDVSMLTFKGPGTGFATYELDRILGKKALVDIDKDVLLMPEMIAQ